MDKQFKKIVQSVFKKKATENMNINNTPEWDSLNFLKLITNLEKKYKKNIRNDQLVNCTNLKNIYKIFKK